MLCESVVCVWLQGLLRRAQDSADSYQESKDRDLVSDEPGFTVEAPEMIFKAGQSKRIWNEVYKVSSVVLHDIWCLPVCCFSQCTICAVTRYLSCLPVRVPWISAGVEIWAFSELFTTWWKASLTMSTKFCCCNMLQADRPVLCVFHSTAVWSNRC